jgi:dihydrofolate reductase
MVKTIVIMATDDDFGIGKDNKIPWKSPEDMKYFREITTGHVVIMGRRTFDSIGRELPKRKNIVISGRNSDGATAMYSNINLAYKYALDYAAESCCDVFIIGGVTIYEWFINNADIDQIHISRIPGYYNCDKFIPYIIGNNSITMFESLFPIYNTETIMVGNIIIKKFMVTNNNIL